MIFSSIQTELIFEFSNFQILPNQNSPYTVTILKVFWGTEEVNYNYIFLAEKIYIMYLQKHFLISKIYFLNYEEGNNNRNKQKPFIDK